MPQCLRSFKIWAAVVFLASLMFFACSSQNVVVEDEVSLDLAAIEAVDFARTLDPDQTGLAKGELTTYRIDYYEAKNGFTRLGGKLTIELDGQQIYLIVPPDVIPHDQYGDVCEIRVWAEKWQTDNGFVYYYECSPSGIQFKAPVTLVQPLSNDNSNVENLFWFDPATVRWVVSDSEDVRTGSANFKIDHFSKYAISD